MLSRRTAVASSPRLLHHAISPAPIRISLRGGRLGVGVGLPWAVGVGVGAGAGAGAGVGVGADANRRGGCVTTTGEGRTTITVVVGVGEGSTTVDGTAVGVGVTCRTVSVRSAGDRRLSTCGPPSLVIERTAIAPKARTSADPPARPPFSQPGRDQKRPQ